jgi:hypothetical protein
MDYNKIYPVSDQKSKIKKIKIERFTMQPPDQTQPQIMQSTQTQPTEVQPLNYKLKLISEIKKFTGFEKKYFQELQNHFSADEFLNIIIAINVCFLKEIENYKISSSKMKATLIIITIYLSIVGFLLLIGIGFMLFIFFIIFFLIILAINIYYGYITVLHSSKCFEEVEKIVKEIDLKNFQQKNLKLYFKVKYLLSDGFVMCLIIKDLNNFLEPKIDKTKIKGHLLLGFFCCPITLPIFFGNHYFKSDSVYRKILSLGYFYFYFYALCIFFLLILIAIIIILIIIAVIVCVIIFTDKKSIK